MSSPRITIGIVLVIAGIITGFLSSTWIISTNIATLWMLSLGGCGLLAIGGAFLMPPRNEQDAPARYVPPRFAGATELHLEELPEPTAGRRLLEFAAATIINAAFLGTLAL